MPSHTTTDLAVRFIRTGVYEVKGLDETHAVMVHCTCTILASRGRMCRHVQAVHRHLRQRKWSL